MSKVKRGAIKRSFTRTYNELKEETDKGKDADEGVMKRKLRQLEDRFNQLDKADEIVIQEMVDQNVSQEAMDE